MPPALACAKCKGNLSLFDVGRSFECPHCRAALTATGWTNVLVFEVLSLAFGVFVLAGAWFWLGWPAAVVAFAASISVEVYVRRTFLKIEQHSLADGEQAT